MGSPVVVRAPDGRGPPPALPADPPCPIKDVAEGWGRSPEIAGDTAVVRTGSKPRRDGHCSCRCHPRSARLRLRSALDGANPHTAEGDAPSL